MPNEFVTADYLASFSGMVIVLALIVQFTKSLVKRRYADEAVRAYTFGWALVLVLLMFWQQGLLAGSVGEIAANIFLAFINAIIVSLAAFGGYAVLSDPRAEKSSGGRPSPR
ncbi:MAG: hypothetical protein AB1402_05905 [Bacillota bacterium]